MASIVVSYIEKYERLYLQNAKYITGINAIAARRFTIRLQTVCPAEIPPHRSIPFLAVRCCFRTSSLFSIQGVRVVKRDLTRGSTPYVSGDGFVFFPEQVANLLPPSSGDDCSYAFLIGLFQ